MAEKRKYLFGDSSPFPLEVNFLELLEAVTDACAALMRIDVEIEHALVAVRHTQEWAANEFAKLETITRLVQSAFTGLPAEPNQESVAETTGAHLRETCRSTLEQARQQVTQMRDQALQQAEHAAGGATALRSLEPLLVAHQLPESAWYLGWQATSEEQVEAWVEEVVRVGLRARLSAELPAEHAWSRPPRVGALADNVVVHVQREGRFFSGAKMTPESLDKYLVTYAETGAEVDILRLHKTMKEGAPGFGFRIPTQSEGRVAMRPLAGRDQLDGLLEPLDGADGEAVRRLWGKVRGALRELPRHRTRLLTASFNEIPVEQINRPRALVEAFVQWMGPLVHELKARSPGEGELTLKTEVDGRRREESFITVESVVSRYADLPPPARAVFDPFGLQAPLSPADLVSITPAAPQPPGLGQVLTDPDLVPPARSPAHRASMPPPPAEPAGVPVAPAPAPRPGAPAVSAPEEEVDTVYMPPLSEAGSGSLEVVDQEAKTQITPPSKVLVEKSKA